MRRITQKDLEQLIRELNQATDHATEPYSKQEDGSYKANPLNYHLYYAYGGVALDQFEESGTGIRRISHDGCGTKRQLHTFLTGFLEGVQQRK